MISYNVIKRPLITEKTNNQKDLFNQLTFEVDMRANRIEIKRAVEEIFKVDVVSVNTVKVKGKVKQRGRIKGKRKDWKKAIVKLAPNERIESFEGA